MIILLFLTTHHYQYHNKIIIYNMYTILWIQQHVCLLSIAAEIKETIILYTLWKITSLHEYWPSLFLGPSDGIVKETLVGRHFGSGKDQWWVGCGICWLVLLHGWIQWIKIYTQFNWLTIPPVHAITISLPFKFIWLSWY